MYGNYYGIPNTQANIDRVNEQIANLEKMKAQFQQAPIPQTPTAINQTFQLAPSSQGNMKFVNSIEDVNKEVVYSDTPFFSNDLSVLWIKNNKNEVKAYSLTEIVQKDEKDLMIESLQYQIEELKKGMNTNATKSDNNNVDEPTESKKSSNVSNVKSRNAK